MFSAFSVGFLVCVVMTTAQKSTYDHQTKTYVSSFQPTTVKGKLSVEGFFSPDHSVDTLSALIGTANKTLDIGTPSASTWLRHQSSSDCGGVPVSDQNKETFPLFNATLNALHRGVKVRLLTNNYEEKLCPDMIDPVTFLALAGVNVTYYASTSFMHAKYIQVDGKKASVSSVNWSRNSFMNNREAGMIIRSGDASDNATPILQFLTNVYEDDLRLGIPYNSFPSYSKADMQTIHNTSVRPVNLPSPPTNRAFISPIPKFVTSDMEVVAFTSPDYALTTLQNDIASASSSLEVYIYQINNDAICSLLQEKFQEGINVTILVSPQIYSKDDQEGALKCYDNLVGAGLKINMVHKYDYSYYSHNKYWIVDQARVGMSTGNWAPTDFPGPPNSYPPYGDAGWRKTNRDFTLRVTDPQIVQLFRSVMQGDMNTSTVYVPKVSGNCATFGCNITYQPQHSCQCNTDCPEYHNCCPDWTSLCDSHAPTTTNQPDKKNSPIVVRETVVAVGLSTLFVALVIGLAIYFATKYARKRRGLSKSFHSDDKGSASAHQTAYGSTAGAEKTPLVN